VAQSAGRFPEPLRWLAPPLGFALAAAVATWPMIGKLGSHLPGYGPNTDNLFHLVFSRWFAVALGQGQNPYHVWWTLFPAGSDSFLGKNGTCFNAALSAPLQPVFGLLAAVNLTGLALLAFNGWATFHLVHHLTKHRAAAFLAGVVLMMVPYNASMLGALSFDQLSVGWALTFLLYLLRTVEEPGWRNPALAGVFFFLTCLSFLGYGLLFGGVGALALGWALAARHARPDRDLLGRLALAALVVGALCAPLALAFKVSGGASSVDPAAAGSFPLALAPSRATLESPASRIVLEGSLRWRDLLALQGVSALLAAAGVVLQPRRAALWVVLVVCFYLLALGPYLQGGDGRWLPLPGLVLYHLGGVFARFRFPFRFIIVTWVAVAVLAGLGAQALARRFARTSGQTGVALAVTLAALVAETALRHADLLPIPHFRAPEVPRYYREVLARQPDAAIISVPLLFEKPSKEAERAFPQPLWHPLEMYYQATHGHRTMAGPETAVQPPTIFTAFARQSRLVQAVAALQQAAHAACGPIPERELRALDELGFGWVVLHERWLARPNAEAIGACLQQLFGPPERYPEDAISVWDLRDRGPLRQGAGTWDWLHPGGPSCAFPVEPQDDLLARLRLAEDAVARGEADAATLALLGRTYEALGWPAPALDAYRRARALDPAVAVDLSGVLVPDTEHPIAGRGP